MATITLTTWNIEHLGKLLPTPPDNRRPRFDAIANEIREIDPDVLCIVEGPGNLVQLMEWVASPEGLGGGYHIATIPGTDTILQTSPDDPRDALKDLYGMQGNSISGNQWIWFLVRDGLFQESGARVLNPEVWRNLNGSTTWPYHRWGELDDRRHTHWRHPQTLILTIGNVEVEVVGAHLKSKINRKSPFDDDGNITQEYVEEAMTARIKLATEAYDIRRYIEGRFEQTPDPRIFVCGDFNDGPGRKYFEREYLFFDLVSNIQGDVFFARRFLNHALFDFDDHLRWTTEFRDRVEEWSREQADNEGDVLPAAPVDPTARQLLDHILFTQTLVGENASPRIHAHAGRVEHTIHQRINALLTSSNQTSDHTPVSVNMTV